VCCVVCVVLCFVCVVLCCVVCCLCCSQILKCYRVLFFVTIVLSEFSNELEDL
jgi:hypothetical protein